MATANSASAIEASLEPDQRQAFEDLIDDYNAAAKQHAMWFFALLLAQIPLPTTCDGVVTELKMNPPAYGDQGRAAYA